MQFVYPSFLYALGFIVIPIVIHLFNLVRPKKVVFSNIQFLKEVELKSSRKVKLKHLLILISRILFVASLVLLFAQPYLSDGNLISENNSPIVSIYIDNSQSMSAIKDDESLFNKAIKEANLIIDKYPRNTKFQLLDNDFKSNSLFLHGKDKIKDYLTEINYTNKTKSAVEIYERQLNAFKNEESDKKQIIWLSDFQKTTFGDISNIKKDTSVEHFIFKIDNGDLNNISIDSLFLVTPFIEKNADNELKVVLKNNGQREERDLNVKLQINDVEVSQATVSIPEQATEEVKLNFQLEEDGVYEAKVEIDDKALIFDNSFNLILNVGSKINILSISDSSNSVFEKLYKNESAFNFRHNNVNSIDYEELKSQNLIILEELKEIPLSLVDELKNYKNITVLALINNEIALESYQSLVNVFGVNISNVDGEKLKLNFPDINNPFFHGIFTKKDSKVEMPFMVNKLRLNGQFEKVLKFNNGKEALIKKDNLFLSTGSFTKESNFLNHSFIVPLMYKIAMESSLENKIMYYLIDYKMKSAYLNLDSLKGVFNIENDEVNITPEQFLEGRELKFSLGGETLEQGVYDLTLGNKVIKKIAFNNSFAEGDLTTVTDEQIALLNDTKIESGSSAASIIGEMNNGVPLWRYFLYLALLFLLIEILLVRFYKS